MERRNLKKTRYITKTVRFWFPLKSTKWQDSRDQRGYGIRVFDGKIGNPPWQWNSSTGGLRICSRILPPGGPNCYVRNRDSACTSVAGKGCMEFL